MNNKSFLAYHQLLSAVERKPTNSTLIRFQPERVEVSPALRPSDMLRDLMNLHFPFFPQEKAAMNNWSPA